MPWLARAPMAERTLSRTSGLRLKRAAGRPGGLAVADAGPGSDHAEGL